jgi:putative membrane protein
MAAPRPRMHARSPTFPLYHSTRKKPRRWPLVLRFIKGAIHVDIAMPVVLHAAWAALIVYIDQVREDHIGLPSSIIPSLSIVVGLMLVFRNSTSYDRFWQVCHP